MSIPKLRQLSVLVVLLLFFTVATGSWGEDFDVPDGNGFLGAYISGAKVGYVQWAIEKKDVAGTKYYRIKWLEERTIKDKKETVEASAAINSDLTLRSLDYKETKGKRVTSIKGRASGKSVKLTVQFSGRKPMPEKKISFTNTCTWDFLAPLCLAWRRLDAGKSFSFERLVIPGCRVVKVSLNGIKTKTSFQDEETEIIEWKDEDGKITLQAKEDGTLLAFTEKSKSGLTKKYIAEPEKVAKSPKTFEEFKEADEGEENGDDKDKKATGKVEGDEEGWFDEYLKPISSKADESEDGDYLKVSEHFSIRAAKGWECYTGYKDHEVDDVWTIFDDDEDDVLILIMVREVKKDDDIIDHDSDDAVKKADWSLMMFNMIMALQLGRYLGANEFYGVSLKQITFPGDFYAYCGKSTMGGRKKYDCFYYVCQNDDYTICAIGLTPRDEFEDYQETLCGMLGSLRTEE